MPCSIYGPPTRRRNVQLNIEQYRAPAFDLTVVWDEHGCLRALDFVDFRARMDRLLQAHYGDHSLEPAHVPRSLSLALDAYFRGDLYALDDIEVRTSGTPFQRKVWDALRTIPAGTTLSYGALAAQIGRTGSARAVGTANRENPVAIVVPCHRVVGGTGALTGYAGGIERKRWLLAHEALGSARRAGRADLTVCA